MDSLLTDQLSNFVNRVSADRLIPIGFPKFLWRTMGGKQTTKQKYYLLKLLAVNKENAKSYIAGDLVTSIESGQTKREKKMGALTTPKWIKLHHLVSRVVALYEHPQDRLAVTYMNSGTDGDSEKSRSLKSLNHLLFDEYIKQFDEKRDALEYTDDFGTLSATLRQAYKEGIDLIDIDLEYEESVQEDMFYDFVDLVDLVAEYTAHALKVHLPQWESLSNERRYALMGLIYAFSGLMMDRIYIDYMLSEQPETKKHFDGMIWQNATGFSVNYSPLALEMLPPDNSRQAYLRHYEDLIENKRRSFVDGLFSYPGDVRRGNVGIQRTHQLMSMAWDVCRDLAEKMEESDFFQPHLEEGLRKLELLNLYVGDAARWSGGFDLLLSQDCEYEETNITRQWKKLVDQSLSVAQTLQIIVSMNMIFSRVAKEIVDDSPFSAVSDAIEQKREEIKGIMNSEDLARMGEVAGLAGEIGELKSSVDEQAAEIQKALLPDASRFGEAFYEQIPYFGRSLFELPETIAEDDLSGIETPVDERDGMLTQQKKRIQKLESSLEHAIDARNQEKSEVDGLKQEVRSLSAANKGLRLAVDAAERRVSSMSKGLLDSVHREALLSCCQQSPTPVQALKSAELLFPERLVVLQSAWESASESSDFERGGKLYEKLLQLCGPYMDALISGVPDSKAKEVLGGEYAAKESESTSNSSVLRKARTFEWNGESRLFEKHLAFGKRNETRSSIRVHFIVDIEQEKVVIGWAGKHLPTVSRA